MTASLVLNNQIRFQGNAAYAMVGIVSGAVINVVLDPILIFCMRYGHIRCRTGHSSQPDM